MKKYKVTYDSENSNTFTVYKDDGTTWNFKQAKSRLYYLDMNSNPGMTVLINMVVDNAMGYSGTAYHQAMTTWKLQ